MLITPFQLIKEPLPLQEQVPEGAIQYTDDIRQVGAMAVEGQAELLIEDRGRGEIVNDIRLRGRFQAHFEQLCARCLDPVDHELDEDFDLIFRPESVDAEPGERAISEEETEIGYYGKGGLLLEDALREQVLLTLPGRALCGDDCRGIPPPNANIRGFFDEEAPEDGPTDSRWKALAGLDLKAKGQA